MKILSGQRFRSPKLGFLSHAGLIILASIFLLNVWSPAQTVQPQVAAGFEHTVGLKSTGTLVAVGYNNQGQLDIGSWTDIVQVATGWYNTVGLRSNGTVVAVGQNQFNQLDIGSWTDIVQVAASMYHTVGLKSNGTVVAAGYNYYGMTDVGSWTDIVQVGAGLYHTVGLKSNGTVVAVGGLNSYGELNVGSWADIVQVAVGWNRTLGLKSDGTVVAVGNDDYGQIDGVDSWTDIVQVATGGLYTLGLKSDGTVVVAGYTGSNVYNAESWTDIVQVAVGMGHVAGLKSDGMVVALGRNVYGQCNTADWDLSQPNQAPVANAGSDQVIEATGPTTSFSLNGAASNDPNGDVLTYKWEDENGNVVGSDSTITLERTLGGYTFKLTVTDPGELSSQAAVTITIRDTTPPSLTVPASVTAEATSSAGAVVTYPAATATDAVSTPTISYSKPSGSIFPLGVTSVTVTAKDEASNTTSEAFNVTVADTTPPSLTAPQDIQVAESDPLGTNVNLGQPKVSDNCDLIPRVVNNAPTVFALGETIVTWKATDASGNFSTAPQKVTVLPGSPANQLTNLSKLVQYSVASGAIAPDLQSSLLAKVLAASDALAKGNRKTAVNNMRLFISQVSAQMNKKITAAVAAGLISRANQIITSLGG